jgi:SAM-dependent methyltransferase
MDDASFPPPELLRQQSAWLAPARARLLRRARIARRRRVLDLACGTGAVTGELVRRCGGTVVALDRNLRALSAAEERFAGAVGLCGNAARLPFAQGSFDLVFCQFALMWLDARVVIEEVRRVLQPGGLLVAVEPDYGGMIEYPPGIATRELWLVALARAGADPQIGRKLPGLAAAAGFRVRVDLLERAGLPASARLDLLRGLPLTDTEKESLRRIERADAACADGDRVVHLPMFLVTAEKP